MGNTEQNQQVSMSMRRIGWQLTRQGCRCLRSDTHIRRVRTTRGMVIRADITHHILNDTITRITGRGTIIPGDIIGLITGIITLIVGDMDMEEIGMPTDTIVESAAGGVAAGSDWLDGKHAAVSRRLRALRFFGLTGSAAEGDMSVTVYIGNVRIGRFYNTATGLIPSANADLLPVGRSVLIPPGTRLSVITETASGTNPAGITIVTDEM
jgi:hypothetical protein